MAPSQKLEARIEIAKLKILRKLKYAQTIIQSTLTYSIITNGVFESAILILIPFQIKLSKKKNIIAKQVQI